MGEVGLKTTEVLGPLVLALDISRRPSAQEPRLPGPLLLPDSPISVPPLAPLSSPQAVQIMNGLFHIALGSLMLIHADVYMPICVTLWYPLWGGIMVSKA